MRYLHFSLKTSIPDKYNRKVQTGSSIKILFILGSDNTIWNFKSVQCYSCIMPMNRNVKANRVSEDWVVTFLQSVLYIIKHF